MGNEYVNNRDVVIKGEITEKEAVESIKNLFKDFWKVDVSYGLHRLKELKSDVVGLPIAVNKILDFVSKLNNTVDHNLQIDTHNVDKRIFNQTKHYDSEGGYCIYMSVLTKTLVDLIAPKEAENFNYYQGYYVIDSENPFATMIYGKTQVGIHAWLTYKNKVLDTTASQHRHSITLPDNKYNMIIGEMPKSYKLKGFKETPKLVNEYKSMFAEQLNMSVSEWEQLLLDAYNK